MDFVKNNKKRLTLLLASMFLLLIPLYLYSCGGGGYSDTQVKQEQSDVMISAATLNEWITNGYGTDQFGYNKIVVLDQSSDSEFLAGHIPGAIRLTSVAAETRSDGVINSVPSMVPSKGTMDAFVQSLGIDKATVIVLTATAGDGNMLFLGRTYFNFRYWGFPKSRLKVLDGVNSAYVAAGYPIETGPQVTIPTPSTYSVCELTHDTSLRASVEEMIKVAEDSDPKTIVSDNRSANEFNGVAGATGGFTAGTKVAFEGHIKTAISQEFTTLLRDGILKPKAELISDFAAVGIDSSATVYAYCRTSFRSGVAFLALDGVLGWPIKLYDGAWIEWGNMTDKAHGGPLESISQWRTDNALLSEAITYNDPANVNQLTANSSAPSGNLINTADAIVTCGASGGGGAAGGY